MGTSAPTTQPDQPPELWTIRGLIASHKSAAAAVAGLLAATVVVFVLVALGAKAGAVTDATTCTQWGSANVNRQSAYAELYLKEHGPIPKWGGSPADVIRAINWGCGTAFGEDVADTTTVAQAISGNF